MAKRQTRVLVLGVIAGLLGLAVVLGVVGAITDNAQVRTISTTTSTAPPEVQVLAEGLGPVGAQLDELIALGRRTSYHATYTVEDAALEGIEQSVEIWRKGADHFRSDIIEKAGNGTRRQTKIQAGTSKRSCETLDGTQTCQIVNVLPGDLPAAFVLAITKDEGTELTVSKDDIAGFQATCFTAEDIGSLCLATDGVMLRLELQKAIVTAARVEDEVPDAAFDVSG